jgi:uncharacterized protein (TIGR03663 family)
LPFADGAGAARFPVTFGAAPSSTSLESAKAPVNEERRMIAERERSAAVFDDAATSEANTRAFHFTFETALYALFVVLAVLTRFWDLGAKALHHDESLHAYYSWVYETGGGYRHDPLMHGPLLFHLNALVYLLVGATNASSRYAPALTGVLVVWLPYLLRGPKHLGRWGALSASFLFLISPTILYQSRYIRHDIYTVAGSMVITIAIFRYLERPQRRWLILGAAAIAASLANHEIIFAVLAIFAGFLYVWLLGSRLAAWRETKRNTVYQIVLLHLGSLIAFLALFIAVPKHYKDKLINIPWENPTNHQQMVYYRHVATNPLILGAIVIIIAFIVGLRALLNRARDEELRDEGWLPSLFDDARDGGIETGVWSMWNDRNGLAAAVAVGAIIFVALFTSLFVNLYGLVSSTVATNGTVLYWLGQHDVRRGEQPWFYFAALAPQYEFIAVLFGTAMAALTIFRGLRALAGLGSAGRNIVFRTFLVVWFIGILCVLSWAGEKMPWLVVHIAEPAILLAAIAIGGLIERAETATVDGRARRLFAMPEWGLFAGLLLAAGSWLFLAGRLTYGKFDQTGTGLSRGLTTYEARHWWLLAIPPAIGLAALVVWTFMRGPRRAGLATMAALTVGITLMQIHGGWRLSYVNPDVSKEMMIYTQTSPDVTRVMDEITRLSYELNGDKSISVWYDSDVSWPMQWYLRDFSGKHFFGDSLSSKPGDAAIVMTGAGHDVDARYLTGYTEQDYVLRWWFPEDLYRDLAIAPELPPDRSAWGEASKPHGAVAVVKSIFHSFASLFKPKGQQHLYRLVMYRDLEQPLGHTDFKIYIRTDLLQQFNDIRY